MTSVERRAVMAERPRSVSLRPGTLVLAGVIVIFVWVGYKTARLYQLGRSLQARQAEAETMFETGIMQSDPAAIQELAAGLRSDVAALRRESFVLVRLAPLLAWLPRFGPLLENADELLAMADAGSEAAALSAEALAPALAIIQEGGNAGDSPIPALLPVLENARPKLLQAAAAVERLAAARANLADEDRLPWRLQTALAQLDAELDLTHDGLRLAAVLPELMGSRGRRTYLIMAQNEDELRPTGGFLSGAGVVVLDEGQILSIDFTDANSVDDWRNKPYDLPPDPYVDFMGMDIFLFRDANFWPDFPTSAERAMELYSYGQGVALDGAIAIDQRFLQMILAAIGPVYVPELEIDVNAGNVTAQMRTAWEPKDDQLGAWLAERKAFMGPLANAMRVRLESGITSLDPILLARAVYAAAEQRHLQIYARDPEVALALAQTGWDGRLPDSQAQDFLAVVETNMGFNKVGSLIQREIAYHVTLVEGGDGRAVLNVSFQHGGRQSSQPCQHGAYYVAGIRYEDLMDGCYYSYVRVYAPGGSRLLGGQGQSIAAEYFLSGKGWDGLPRTVDEPVSWGSVFANFLLLPQGQQAGLRFNYELPQVAARLDDTYIYRLTVRKQAGTETLPVRVRVTLPPGAVLLETSPEPRSVDGQDVLIEGVLDTDRMFRLAYHRAETAP